MAQENPSCVEGVILRQLRTSASRRPVAGLKTASIIASSPLWRRSAQLDRIIKFAFNVCRVQQFNWCYYFAYHSSLYCPIAITHRCPTWIYFHVSSIRFDGPLRSCIAFLVLEPSNNTIASLTPWVGRIRFALVVNCSLLKLWYLHQHHFRQSIPFCDSL